MIENESAESSENRTISKTIDITVPDEVVGAIADRLATLEDPDRVDAIDLLHDHVETTSRFETTAGDSAIDAALERAEECPCAKGETDAPAGGTTLEFDEDDVASSDDRDATPEPIDVDAAAQLDFAADPERPLSIELEVPAGVIDEDDLDEYTSAVRIEARVAGDAE